MPLMRRHRSWFDVTQYGAEGDGTTDDTAAIQAAIDAAETFVDDNTRKGAVVYFPPGCYLVSETLTVEYDGISLEGHGPGGDTGTAATIITPTADFADDTYVLSFDHHGGTRPVSGVRLHGIRIGEVAELSNTVHGIYFRAYRSRIVDVHVAEMSGHGIVLEGYSSPWDAYQNKLLDIQVEQCGSSGTGSGIEVKGNVIELHVTDSMIHGNVYGYHGGCTGNRFTAVHFWGNDTNVLIDGSGVQPQFSNCSFREPTEHNFIIDCAGGAITDFLISNCNFRTTDTLTTNNTYDNFIVMRSSGTSTASGVMDNCVFISAGSSKDARYHVNLSGAAASQIRLGDSNRYDNNAATGKINHSSSAVRCLVGGLGINVGNPTTTGQWNGFAERGVSVWDTGGTTIYLCYDGTNWAALN